MATSISTTTAPRRKSKSANVPPWYRTVVADPSTHDEADQHFKAAIMFLDQAIARVTDAKALPDIAMAFAELLRGRSMLYGDLPPLQTKELRAELASVRAVIDEHLLKLKGAR